MPSAPREVARFADRLRAPLDAAGFEVVTLPPGEANLPTESGGVLDVFEVQPTPAGNPLRFLPDVVLTPHAVGVDTQSLEDVARSAAEAIASLYEAWPSEKLVNPEVRAAFCW